MGNTLDNFNPYFVAAWNALNAHCGGTSSVGSGYRTIEEQRALLYKRAQGISVADPGTSRHEGNHGGAIDVEFGDDNAKSCIHANANAYGLNFGVAGEDWHLEFSDEGEAAALDGTFDEKFGIDAQGEAEEAEPESPFAGIRDRLYGTEPQDIPERVAKWQTAKTKPVAQGPLASAGADQGEFVPEASAGFVGGGSISAGDAAKYLAAAGFRGDALVTAVAVAMGESGLQTDAVGDTSLVGGGWGPSIGLMQIRSRTAGDEANGWRDGSRLADPVFNAQAAFALSNGGTNFSPWTVYNEGIYTKHVAEAKAAVVALGSAGFGDLPSPAVAPGEIPPASVDEKDEMTPEPNAGLDPAGMAQSIADMMLARKGSPGDIIANITDVVQNPDEDDGMEPRAEII
jgi:hypothetical protein